MQDFTDEQIERITDNLSYLDKETSYDDFLDEITECCEMCKRYGAARLLEEVDPIAYRCGFSDYLDSLSDSYYEIDEEYYLQSEVDEIIEEMEEEDE